MILNQLNWKKESEKIKLWFEEDSLLYQLWGQMREIVKKRKICSLIQNTKEYSSVKTKILNEDEENGKTKLWESAGVGSWWLCVSVYVCASVTISVCHCVCLYVCCREIEREGGERERGRDL